MRFTLCLLVLAMSGALAVAAETAKPRVRLETNKGTIIVELEPAKAPKTVANFLQYVRDGYYSNMIFHRCIKNFMIQGGGVTERFAGKPLRPPIENEAANGLRNTRGTIAMARTGEVHSATAQFFINLKDNPFLDYRDSTAEGFGYCAFGKVVSGLEVVDAIAAVPTGPAGPYASDVPKEPVIILKATVDEPAKAEPPPAK